MWLPFCEGLCNWLRKPLGRLLQLICCRKGAVSSRLHREKFKLAADSFAGTAGPKRSSSCASSVLHQSLALRMALHGHRMHPLATTKKVRRQETSTQFSEMLSPFEANMSPERNETDMLQRQYLNMSDLTNVLYEILSATCLPLAACLHGSGLRPSLRGLHVEAALSICHTTGT